MAVRTSEAEWRGNLHEGKGTVRLGSGAFDGSFSFGSRFEDAKGTNPEELIAAAHAGCFSMALAAGLSSAGHAPTRVHTDAAVTIEKVGEGFQITEIHLTTEAEVPGIDETAFLQHAEATKVNCPVSRALSAVRISLDAKLV